MFSGENHHPASQPRAVAGRGPSGIEGEEEVLADKPVELQMGQAPAYLPSGTPHGFHSVSSNQDGQGRNVEQVVKPLGLIHNADHL